MPHLADELSHDIPLASCAPMADGIPEKMGNCASSPCPRSKRRGRKLPRKIKVRDRRRSSTGHALPKIRTTLTSPAQSGTQPGGRRSTVETVSPRSIISEESIYYSDTEWQEGSPHHPAHSMGHQHDSDLREEAVEDFEEEQTLVDKLAAWWHGFSLLGDGENTGDPDDPGEGSISGEERHGIVLDEDGMKARIQEHQEQQRRWHPHRVTIIEEDDDSISASLSCVSFSKKKRPLRLSRVSAGTETTPSREAGAREPSTSRYPNSSSPSPPSVSSPLSLPLVKGSKRLVRSWASPDPASFNVRSKNYMKDKIKLPAECSLYRMIHVETMTLPSRKDHVAEHLDVPTPSAASIKAGKQVGLPPILIIQLQMPMYSPVLFGEHDGESCSLIYYSELDPDVANMPKHAVDLAVRFVRGGTEEDGQASRDRFKLIPRIVNVEEWGQEAGLSNTELRLVNNYNGKPLLMRPQFKFYEDEGQTYFEVDVDIHNYAYIARRAFCGYVPRLGPSVFENGFVIQGNNERELPEVLLTASRIYRVDFRRVPQMSL